MSVILTVNWQRGELASDRARDPVLKSLILEAVSRDDRCHDNDYKTTTECRIQMMGSEISSAAREHRNLVDQMTLPSPQSDASSIGSGHRPADGMSTSTYSSGTRSPSISTTDSHAVLQ